MIAQMHSVGMDTLIWSNTAFWGRPLFPGQLQGTPDSRGACMPGPMERIRRLI